MNVVQLPQTTASRDPFPLKQLTAGELLDRNFPVREFAIDPWLRTGESALLWAATGVGKTWLTLSIALAIAGGGSVWQWQAPSARKVLLIDGEMNTQDLQERIRFLLEHGAVKGVSMEALRANLILMPRQFQDPRERFYDITDEGAQRAILARMEKEEAEVIIIDNMTTCADGLADENDATAFRSVMGFLLMMKQAGKTAILVHHANKSGADARGSTALEATFEVKLGLRPPDVSRPGQAAFVTEFGKFRARGDERLSPKVWTLGEEGWSVEDDGSGTAGKVLTAVRSLDYVNQREIATALGVDKGTVSRVLTKAVALQQVTDEALKTYFIRARTIRSGGAVDRDFDGENGTDDLDQMPF